ncbi:MAG: hypothetical protein V4772_13775, partial [Pseudomonadota bacterium]
GAQHLDGGRVNAFKQQKFYLGFVERGFCHGSGNSQPTLLEACLQVALISKFEAGCTRCFIQGAHVL